MNWFLSSLLLFVSFIGMGQAPTPTNNGIVVESNKVIVLDSFSVTPASIEEKVIIKSEFTSKKKGDKPSEKRAIRCPSFVL